MTKEEAYLEWIKEYTNNDFKDGVPGMIDLIIAEMIEHDEQGGQSVSSESLGDYSVSFDTSKIGYPKATLGRLRPYVKVKFV